MPTVFANFNPTSHLILLLFFCSSSFLNTIKLCLADAQNASVQYCIDSERQAILAFKQDLTDPSDRLSSWAGSDCCRWKGISCNKHTGRVSKIDLSNTEDEERLGGKMNPSLLSLKYLEYLDLSKNNFEGILIPEFLGELKSLRYLNVSYALFGGEIPSSLGNLSNLNYLDLSDQYSNLLEISSTNFTWFSHLSSLKYLNLMGMDLSNAGDTWLHALNMIPSLLELHLSFCKIQTLPFSLNKVNFTSLLVLDMSNNPINSSLPRWIFNLTSLRKFDARLNYFRGPIPSEFARLKYLERLDLAGNDLEGQIPGDIGNLCKLKTLRLNSNKLSGGIEDLLNGFSNCTNSPLIESLDLSYNHLQSKFPISLGMLKNVQYLGLGVNSFWGSIPESIGNLSSLTTLQLSANSMNGSIPESLGQLSELVYLDLSRNSWEGVLTETHFKNLTRLQDLKVGGDQPTSLIFNMSHDWVPPFKLQSIDIQNCQVGPAFPTWLQSQSELLSIIVSGAGMWDSIPEEWFMKMSSQLIALDFSRNKIHGVLPPQLQFPNVSTIRLSHNQFEGPLPLWFSKSADILDLENNLFSGAIPSNYDELFPELKELYLGENQLEGIIPPSLCNMRYLLIISLRSNQLSGRFPQTWTMWTQLVVLDASNNSLTGKIHSTSSKNAIPRALRILKMGNNKFDGAIPSSMQNCSNLKILGLSGNQLAGDIPSWMGPKLPNLSILQLRSNSFHGLIPQELCMLVNLHILDLGRNDFSGTIPKCLSNMTTFTRDDPNYVRFFPRYGIYGSYNEQATLIDLSWNNLQGEIPEDIANLKALRTLSLSRNQFSGDIPSNIGNLSWLETLDLSHNHLSGPIPQSLSYIAKLSHLYLSYNNLSGRIPSGNQFQTLFDPSTYEGNPLLCGSPLPTKCPGDETRRRPPPPNDDHEDDDKEFWF